MKNEKNLDPWMGVVDIGLFPKKTSELSLLEIESFFGDVLGYDVVLLPSARAALALLLKYYSVSRGTKIFIPEWSSHCVISTTGAFGSVSYLMEPLQSLFLCVHKFGITHQLSSKGVVIEDSVDSLFEDGRSLFRNNSEAEVVSLPKIMGTNSGGLLVTKNKAIKAFALELRKLTPAALSLSQFQKKLAFNSGEGSSYWGFDEVKNFGLCSPELSEIQAKIPLYLINLSLIKERFDRITENFQTRIHPFKEGRYGTSVFLPNLNIPGLPEQHFNFSLNYNEPNFIKGTVMPIHMQVSDEQLKNFLEHLKNI